MSPQQPRIAVVIPSYKVSAHVRKVIASIGSEVQHIIVVDDACPEGSGEKALDHPVDPRVLVTRHSENQGVGGAMMTGYAAALELNVDIVVKIDGDGQMDPAQIPKFITPIWNGQADYTKGNRFYDLRSLKSMPRTRLIGNAALSFLNKLSSGYWSNFDPTNGYTAIHTNLLKNLAFEKVNRGYFFESDLLFRLNLLRARVLDIPMKAHYGDEKSNLNITKEISRFAVGHLRNLGKRVFYTYFLRDFSVASIQLLGGLLLMTSGIIVGVAAWANSISTGITATAGTVMLSTLPIILGFQLLLSFLTYDISNEPKSPVHQIL